jgi:RNA polymerase sigma-70 factor (ECF subfamily)
LQGTSEEDVEEPQTVSLSQLSGKPQELKRDDGKPAGKKSFPMGHAVAFEAPGDAYYMTSVRIHGARYGYTQPPKEDFHVTLCDADFATIADFPFAYSKFQRGDSNWVSLRVKPTKVPRNFVLCVNFNPTRTKGVYVSHDAEGKALVGLPDKPSGTFSGGDWLIRVSVDQLK